MKCVEWKNIFSVIFCNYIVVTISRVPERVRRGGGDGERAGAGVDLGDGAARLEADALPGGRRDERRQGGGEQDAAAADRGRPPARLQARRAARQPPQPLLQVRAVCGVWDVRYGTISEMAEPVPRTGSKVPYLEPVTKLEPWFHIFGTMVPQH